MRIVYYQNSLFQCTYHLRCVWTAWWRSVSMPGQRIRYHHLPREYERTMAETVTMPEKGQLAPDFEGRTQDGSTVRLSDYRGRKVALYFYPKDDTPGCTKQGCNLRDNYSLLLSKDIAVIGVSADDEESHKAFADKYSLPFPLLADTDKHIVKEYGVWGERNLYGNKFMGIKRTTFLIDEEGRIVHVFKRPNVEDHAGEILRKFGLADSSTEQSAAKK